MERIDELCVGGYKIYQDEGAFRFGTDAVLLYGFMPKGCGRCADLCSGNGAVALMLLGGEKADAVTALELQESAVSLARKSAVLNGCENRLTLVNADICKIKVNSLYSQFDTVCVNPPYFKKGSGILPPEKAVALARHEVACTLFDVLEAAAFLLKDEGDFYMVHRVARKEEILSSLQKFGFAAIEVCDVFSAPKQPGPLFLLHAKKTAQVLGCKHSTFTVLDDNRALSDEYIAILRK